MEKRRRIWIALTGQILFFGDRIPRAMPSATMAQAYSLRTCLELGRNCESIKLKIAMIDMTLFILRQLVTEVPLIMVCIGCIVVGFIFWKRAPLSSLYVVLACVLTLLLLVGYPAAWWIARAFGAKTESILGISFGIGWSIARSVSTILLVMAAYVGRK
jgi:hypothetical protein